MTNDLEKEIELAEDLKGKLDKIEGKKTRKPRNKVSQEVKSPADADRQAVVGEMDNMKQKLTKIDEDETAVLEIPDPKKHKYISFVKSGVRIVAAVFLGAGDLVLAGAFFIIAEFLGIIEEMV